MKLNGQLIPVEHVTPAQKNAMFRLMDRCYVHVRETTFLADLAEKRWVITLADPVTGGLCGFSTQMLLHVEVEGRPVTALFSGDTIIAPEYWGDAALTHVWGNLALKLMDQHVPGSLYWYLISKGYKTYRLLPVFFHEFYPRWDVPTPPRIQKLIDALGAHKFPQAYDAARGIVRAGPDKDRLRSGVADITPDRLKDPHVRFFLERNARHADGEELCCLAPLSRENFTAAAYRVIAAKSVATGGQT